MKLGYIPEIDFLRAMAVVPVIIFHLSYDWIPGGFLGVDVFFVISGFLITSILLKEKKESKLEYFRLFYLRRIRRILPVFFVVTLATLACGYYLLLPEAYTNLGESAAAATSFVSNLYFTFKTGYFDAPANQLALLHTWSLAIEEQFYFLWPVLILLITRLNSRKRWHLTFSLLALSLILSIAMTDLAPNVAFYNLPFRAFEFLIGAIIPVCFVTKSAYLGISKATLSILAYLGLCLIVYSYLSIKKTSNIPGWFALLPASGASLFIAAVVHPAYEKAAALRFPVFLGIGKISFSLYLWHWPVITLFRVYQVDDKLTQEDRLILLLITFGLSVISYFLVEKPFRFGPLSNHAIQLSISCATIIFVLCGTIVFSEGLPGRISGYKEQPNSKEMWYWDCPQEIHVEGSNKSHCNFGLDWHKSDSKVLLWGDSHAEQISPYLQILAQRHGLSFLEYRSCRPLTDGNQVRIRHKNPKRATEGCYHSTKNALRLLGKDPSIKLVIFAGAWDFSLSQLYTKDDPNPDEKVRWDMAIKGMLSTIDEVGGLGRDVLVLGDIPHPGKDRTECYQIHDLIRRQSSNCEPISSHELAKKHTFSEWFLTRLKTLRPNIHVHSIIKHHCKGVGNCPIYFDDVYIYRDGDHVRRDLSEEIKYKLIESFKLETALEWSRYQNK